MNILIVKTSAIGDVLHTLPALQALRRHYPAAHISWLVEEAAAGIVRDHPELDEVLVSPRKGWIELLRAGRLWRLAAEFLRFVHRLRARRYDLLIDFQGLLKSSVLIACCRAERKVGFGRGMAHAEGSWLFLNERIPPVDMDIHAVDRELHLLAAIGIETGGVAYRLPLTGKEEDRAAALLVGRGVAAGEDFVCINPMTTWETKHWSEEGFAAVADRLRDEGLAVVFTGGAGDRGAIDGILSRMRRPGAINMAGMADLKELAAVYRRARLLVTTDTGPMHVAAAVGTPIVALFGPTAPWRTGPYGQGHRIVRRKLDCSPCFKRRCPLGTRACMEELGVETVLAAILPQLRAKGNCPGAGNR
ncbi:MAG: glycosyltransferase family 9 protein [Thermodesulfobacteriota bacterium]